MHQNSHYVVPRINEKSYLKYLATTGFSDLDESTRADRVIRIHRIQLIVGLALMMFKFPTRTKVSWWAQDRLSELQCRRAVGRQPPVLIAAD